MATSVRTGTRSSSAGRYVSPTTAKRGSKTTVKETDRVKTSGKKKKTPSRTVGTTVRRGTSIRR